MSTYDDVVSVTGLAYVAGEDAQGFLRSILEAINDLGDDQWNDLSASAQDWFNEMARRVENDDRAQIDLLDGMITDVETAPAVEAAPAKRRSRQPKAVKSEDVAVPAMAESKETSAEEVVKKGRKVRQPKAEKPPTVKKERTVARSDVKSALIRAALCKNMDVSVDEILAAIDEAGYTSQRTWVQTYRTVSLRMLQEVLAVGEVKDAKGNVVLRKV